MSGILQALFVSASGAGGLNASLPSSLSVEDLVLNPNTATASFTLNSGGIYTSSGNITAPSGTWKTGTGVGSDYETRLTVTSGSFSGSGTGSWLSLGTTRTWYKTQSGVGTADAGGTVEIRNASTGTVYTSSVLSLFATVEL